MHHSGVKSRSSFALFQQLLPGMCGLPCDVAASCETLISCLAILQLRAQIAQNLAHLKGPPGVQFHERAPDAMDVDELPNLEPKVCPLNEQRQGLPLDPNTDGVVYRWHWSMARQGFMQAKWTMRCMSMGCRSLPIGQQAQPQPAELHAVCVGCGVCG